MPNSFVIVDFALPEMVGHLACDPAIVKCTYKWILTSYNLIFLQRESPFNHANAFVVFAILLAAQRKPTR